MSAVLGKIAFGPRHEDLPAPSPLHEVSGPKIPIPGAAGAAIFAALQALAMRCGDGSVVIRKERLPNGGYTYLIGHNENPARPVRS